MDPSPYEDNYLVHLCFHYIEKYFSSSPHHNLFPSPNHKGLLVFISHSLVRKAGSPAHPQLHLMDAGLKCWGNGREWGQLWNMETTGRR